MPCRRGNKTAAYSYFRNKAYIGIRSLYKFIYPKYYPILCRWSIIYVRVQNQAVQNRLGIDSEQHYLQLGYLIQYGYKLDTGRSSSS